MMRCAGAAVAVAVAVALLLGVAGATASGSPGSGHGGTCARRGSPPFLHAIGSRCPFARIEPSLPLEVRGVAVDTELNLRRRGASYSILFYSAWCPFSSKFRPIFEALSTMYPQIQHFSVEESSATPRYGVRSFPAILLVNETAMVRYRGSKDLNSLVDFYKETTGLDPIAHLDVDQQESTGSLRSVMPWDRSLREMAKDEPFLLLAVLFIILKVVAHLVHVVLSHLRAFLVVRVRNLNLRIRRGSNQLLERILNVLDAKRLWSKLKLSNKATDLRKGASNARAWASSFASVSLGEPSSLRQA
ncbi:5'-adenylylsulfate reductase-like 5 isoform X2 [Phragmites australis]|uniref:5'-adenylylsulfate reductase-like 5 isoform X2 n=1 Tax=Phragmites australis TaxID=29695 RepID=UPI002D783973|nr:5'-adenylylsulfate reductase-like 5 isoform X2 [Phragmites australis]